MRDLLQIPLAIFRRYYRKLWLRVTLYALLSLGIALGGPVLGTWLELRTGLSIGQEQVRPILTILASSMLAVSTFSLNVMVSAHRDASQMATPRIHRLLLADTTTQAVLATFIGAFVYALTTLILLQFGVLDDSAAVVIMAVTVLVVGLVIAAMLRWIAHLSRLGSLDESVRLLAVHTAKGLSRLARDPAMAANAIGPDTVMPEALRAVPAPRSGYVQLVDVAGLESCLNGPSHCYVTRAPGHHVLAGQPLAQVSGKTSENDIGHLAECFVIGTVRTHEQDPEFGLIALSEIGSRALSPGLNDPGTAIQTIGWAQRLLWDYARAARPDPDVRCPHVFLPVPSAEQMIDAAFGALARDAAGTIEAAVELRQALLRLSASPDPDLNAAALAMAELALCHAETALPLDVERARLKATTA